MSRAFVLLLLGVGGCLAAPRGASLGAQAAGPRALSARELTAIRSAVASEPQWSTDGSMLMFNSPLGEGGLWAVPASGGFPTALNVRTGGTTFLGSAQPEWSPDGKWLSYVSTKSGTPELWLSSIADGRERQLTNLGGRIGSYTWAPDGSAIAFSDDKLGNHDIWTIRIADGHLRRLTTGPLLEVSPTWTPDGRQVVYVQLDSTWRNHDVLVMAPDGSGPRVIVQDTGLFDYQAGGAFGPALVSPDGTQLLFRSQRSGWMNYWAVPMKGGAARPIAAEPANQSGARWSPDGRHVLYLALQNGTQHLRAVALAGGVSRSVASPPGMGMISAANWSPDGRRVSYVLASPTTPGDLYVVPFAGGPATRLTHSDPPAHIAQSLITPEKLTYRSEDGLEISAYLYRPRGLAANERAPGLLWIHGGPTAQFSDALQRDVQFFAMRGYAVLLPNIRGSSGYGRAFEEANNGCWGRCDLLDVLAGVAQLKKLPEVRPDRMGITGASYGGFMSMAAPVFAPRVFQAAIAASGYGDWVHTVAEQETRHVKLLEHEFGPLNGNLEKYRQSSPIYELDKLQTPIMLVHGEATTIPRSDASRLFADRLEMLYKPFVYRTYPNENYYISSRENTVALLHDMLGFFQQHLKDGAVHGDERGSRR